MRGVLYSAVRGNPIYLDWATYSAKTVKAAMPDVRVGVYTNMMGDAKKHKVYDDIWAAPKDVAREDLQGIFIKAMLECTYDTTIFLGCDCVVCGDLRPVMEVMEQGYHDLALTQPRNHNWPRYPLCGVPEGFPKYNDGFLCFPRTEPVIAFLEDWWETFNWHKKKYHRLRKVKGGMHPTQEPMQIALWRSNLRLVVLPKNYNEQFWTGCVYGKVMVLHMHGAGSRKAWKMAGRLNADTKHPRVFRNREIL